MARGFLERADAVAEGCGSGVDGCRFFNFGYESRTDDRGVSKTTQNRDMAGKRDAEADGDRKLRDAAGAAQECREIVGQSILRAGDAGARDEIEKTGGASRDFCEAIVRGSRRAEENGVEMMSGENAAIVFGFFGREIRGEDAVGAGGRSEEHTSELQSRLHLVCRLLLEKKKKTNICGGT